jgi:glucose-6-phosphate isomerase
MRLPVLDYGNMLSPRLDGRGLDPADLGGRFAERFRGALHAVEERRSAGDMGFFDLPYATETLAHVRELADGFGQWFDSVVVLGIGGSGLGAVMLRDALLGPGWNERTPEGREWFPALHVLDNPDPHTLTALLARLDLRRTLFNVVSKSGSTAETLALYLVIKARLQEVVDGDKVHGHFLFTTDPDRGALRRIAEAEGVPTLPVPPNVGGRYSVLSPVGLLPAGVCGIDLEKLLSGAAEMGERCRAESLERNPAGLLATLLHAADREHGKHIHVLMPYADRLRALGWWFQQLWAESLGKTVMGGSGAPLELGPTPLPALGAVDQHSQVQLFMDGPRDKVLVFVAVEDPGDPVPIPALHPEIDELSYLGGRSLGELLEAERRATAEALRLRGRPSMTIEVPEVDPVSVGALVMLFEAATVYAGALYGVDPLDQPGVELGKELTYGLLGRQGRESPPLLAPDPRWRA